MSEFRNKILNGESEDDSVFKFRVSKVGKIIRFRKNSKDLNIVRKRIKEDFYNYDEFINSVVDSILEDLDL